MVTLDELHEGDIIYQVYKYHWIEKVKIISNKGMFDYQDILSDKINYCVDAIFLRNNVHNTIFEYDEKELYLTKEEAEKSYHTYEKQQIEFLKQNNNLSKFLLKKTKGFLSNGDVRICQQIIDELKDK
jgi:hypothetical protein